MFCRSIRAKFSWVSKNVERQTEFLLSNSKHKIFAMYSHAINQHLLPVEQFECATVQQFDNIFSLICSLISLKPEQTIKVNINIVVYAKYRHSKTRKSSISLFLSHWHSIMCNVMLNTLKAHINTKLLCSIKMNFNSLLAHISKTHEENEMVDSLHGK